MATTAKKPERSELLKATFYDLTAEEHQLVAELEDFFLGEQAAEGAEPGDENLGQQMIDDLILQLSQTQELRDAKLDRMCAAIRHLDAEADALAAEVERLKARAERKAKSAEWIEAQIVAWMESQSLDKFETRSGANRITLRDAGREPVLILDESKITALPPDCWKEIPATYQPVKDAIYKALKAGFRINESEQGEAEAKANPFEGVVALGPRTKVLKIS